MTAGGWRSEVGLGRSVTAGTAQRKTEPAGTPQPLTDNDGAAAVEVDLLRHLSAGTGTPERKGSTVDEVYLAARCWHLHGEPGPMSDSEKRAQDEKHRLLERRKGRDWNRDDRKLLRRLERFDRANAERNLAHFKACPDCSG